MANRRSVPTAGAKATYRCGSCGIVFNRWNKLMTHGIDTGHSVGDRSGRSGRSSSSSSSSASSSGSSGSSGRAKARLSAGEPRYFCGTCGRTYRKHKQLTAHVGSTKHRIGGYGDWGTGSTSGFKGGGGAPLVNQCPKRPPSNKKKRARSASLASAASGSGSASSSLSLSSSYALPRGAGGGTASGTGSAAALLAPPWLEELDGGCAARATGSGDGAGVESASRTTSVPSPYASAGASGASGASRLHDEILAFAAYVELSPLEVAARNALVQQINAVLGRRMSLSVEPFGSFATRVCTFLSDVDLCLFGKDGDAAAVTAVAAVSAAAAGGTRATARCGRSDREGARGFGGRRQSGGGGTSSGSGGSGGSGDYDGSGGSGGSSEEEDMRYFVGADCSEDEEGFDFDAAGGVGGEGDDDDDDDGGDDDDDDDDDGDGGWGGQQFRAQSRKQVQEVLWQARKILSKERWVKGLSLRGKARVPVLYIRSGKPQRLSLFQPGALHSIRLASAPLSIFKATSARSTRLHYTRVSANYVSNVHAPCGVSRRTQGF